MIIYRIMALAILLVSCGEQEGIQSLESQTQSENKEPQDHTASMGQSLIEVETESAQSIHMLVGTPLTSPSQDEADICDGIDLNVNPCLILSADEDLVPIYLTLFSQDGDFTSRGFADWTVSGPLQENFSVDSGDGVAYLAPQKTGEGQIQATLANGQEKIISYKIVPGSPYSYEISGQATNNSIDFSIHLLDRKNNPTMFYNALHSLRFWISLDDSIVIDSEVEKKISFVGGKAVVKGLYETSDGMAPVIHVEGFLGEAQSSIITIPNSDA